MIAEPTRPRRAQYLKSMGREVFTSKSKGALALLVVYFYVTYVVSLAFFLADADVVTPPDVNPATGNNTLCGTLDNCYVALVSARPGPAGTARVHKYRGAYEDDQFNCDYAAESCRARRLPAVL